jgi:hypothetical protein
VSKSRYLLSDKSEAGSFLPSASAFGWAFNKRRLIIGELADNCLRTLHRVFFAYAERVID